MPTAPFLRLASTSETRRTLLAATGLAFESAKPPVDEAKLKSQMPNAGVKDIAIALSKAKALSLSTSQDDTIVIGADQTLDLDGNLFDKPEGEKAARAQLQDLSGKTHLLHSAISCARNGSVVWEHVASASLTMRSFSNDELDRYIAQMGPRLLTSVGGYQIEGLAITLFERIDGDYFTILGMPMLPLLAFLRQCGCQLP